eukprot:2379340-Pleurochrysis_carterae.AAC.2
MSNLLRAEGSDIKTLDSARRALEQTSEFATHMGLENGGLPASALFVTDFLRRVEAIARSRAHGSKGGATVVAGVRSGLLFLSAHLRAPLEVSEMIDSVIAPPRPLALYC